MKFQQHLSRLACAIAACSAMALPAHADYIALDSTRPSGNQNWTGPLGMDFTVNSAIRITMLGAYDGLPAGLGGDITVGIFSLDTMSLVGTSAVLNTGNTVAGGAFNLNRFFDVTDFILGPGNYTIVADGYSVSEANGNTHGGALGGPTIDTGGGLITFTGSARYGNSGDGFSLPMIIDGGPVNRYDAGTFQFTEVPEPASITLAAIGLIGLGLSRRKRHG